MPNFGSPVIRACLCFPLGLAVQAVSGTDARGVMSVSVQVVATCTASTQPRAPATAQCEDRTPFVLSRAVQLSPAGQGVQVLTICY